MGESAKMDQDFRNILREKEIDAITIATPDHWHAPMAIAALQAGKHVYWKSRAVTIRRSALLVQSQKKVRQVGADGHPTALERHTRSKSWTVSQRRDWTCLPGQGLVLQCAQIDRDGQGRAPVSTADWDLWQGPAPRALTPTTFSPTRHWFELYGNRRSTEQRTHEIDVCRWALGRIFQND